MESLGQGYDCLPGRPWLCMLKTAAFIAAFAAAYIACPPDPINTATEEKAAKLCNAVAWLAFARLARPLTLGANTLLSAALVCLGMSPSCSTPPARMLNSLSHYLILAAFRNRLLRTLRGKSNFKRQADRLGDIIYADLHCSEMLY